MNAFEKLALYIDGEWRELDGRTYECVTDPGTGKVLGLLPHATAQDVEDALTAARDAFESWKNTPALHRSRLILDAVSLIRERKGSIAEALAAEQGKPIAEAKAEVERAADMIEFCAQEARRIYGRVIPAREVGVRQTVIKEPVGPVAGLTPWNFPAISPARKIGGALAAGCSIVLKPSEEVPATAIALVRAFHDAGLPKGVLNLVFGIPGDIARQLIESPIIRKIAFTGSVPVGKTLARLAADNMKGAVMELGGHAPVIVCNDVDPAAAAEACVKAKFRNAGQICISPTRFYAHRKIFNAFKQAFAEKAAAIRVGDVRDPETQMGPLINARRLAAIEGLVSQAVAVGANVLAGGRKLDRPGFFYAPTVIEGAGENAHISFEEPFGPVALLEPFDELDEAIVKANSLPYGLAAYAFTRDAAVVETLSNRLEAGVIGINRFGVSEPETPFGGVKDSGYGREGGVEGLESYLTTKFVAHSYSVG
jgi:succinate-semialdehyde dehydrogenase/glutarate-semialdehyde dehydrogenase